RVIAADEPVEPVVEGLALKPKFLAETLELVEGAAVAGAEQDVEIVEIGVLPAGIFIVAVGRDRGQLAPAEIVDQLARNSPVRDIRIEVPPGRDRDVAPERTVLNDCSQAAFDRRDRRGLLGNAASSGRDD